MSVEWRNYGALKEGVSLCFKIHCRYAYMGRREGTASRARNWVGSISNFLLKTLETLIIILPVLFLQVQTWVQNTCKQHHSIFDLEREKFLILSGESSVWLYSISISCPVELPQSWPGPTAEQQILVHRGCSLGKEIPGQWRDLPEAANSCGRCWWGLDIARAARTTPVPIKSSLGSTSEESGQRVTKTFFVTGCAEKA